MDTAPTMQSRLRLRILLSTPNGMPRVYCPPNPLKKWIAYVKDPIQPNKVAHARHHMHIAAAD